MDRMGRIPLTSLDQLRTVVRDLLAEGSRGAPVTAPLYRQLTSVRRVRERLGGGDPARLGRDLRALEPEFVKEWPTWYERPPDVPEGILAQSFAFWREALEVARHEFDDARAQADAAIAAAGAERDEALARVALLRTELTDSRTQLSARDEALGEARAALATCTRLASESEARIRVAEEKLAEALREHDLDRIRYKEEADNVGKEYRGLSRQLLNDVDRQRQAISNEMSRLEQQLKATGHLLDEVTKDRDRLRDEMARRGGPASGSGKLA
ncbi:DNA-binding protein [Paraburkholderia azotifigens]|uniref:DNA-binding protein n=1 Tax=Paraburkholderia azotifigens TaxID=2057004 RepID=UPI00319E0A17